MKIKKLVLLCATSLIAGRIFADPIDEIITPPQTLACHVDTQQTLSCEFDEKTQKYFPNLGPWKQVSLSPGDYTFQFYMGRADVASATTLIYYYELPNQSMKITIRPFDTIQAATQAGGNKWQVMNKDSHTSNGSLVCPPSSQAIECPYTYLPYLKPTAVSKSYQVYVQNQTQALPVVNVGVSNYNKTPLTTISDTYVGPGKTTVVANGSTGPDGETIQSAFYLQFTKSLSASAISLATYSHNSGGDNYVAYPEFVQINDHYYRVAFGGCGLCSNPLDVMATIQDMTQAQAIQFCQKNVKDKVCVALKQSLAHEHK